METPLDDSPVTLEAIAEIRGQLFHRWIPAFVSLGLKLLTLFAAGGLGLYFLFLYARPEWGRAFTFWVVVAYMAAIVALPFSLYVAQSLWLDFRIARRMDGMAQRVRSGESVHASELAL
jgi:hypothetical protein